MAEWTRHLAELFEAGRARREADARDFAQRFTPAGHAYAKALATFEAMDRMSAAQAAWRETQREMPGVERLLSRLSGQEAA